MYLSSAYFRPSCTKPMTVERAKFEQKGEFKKRSNAEKRKRKAAVQKQEKALGWTGFDDKGARVGATVIFKYMFTPEELLQDPSSQPELEVDVASECGKLGKVERLKLFKHNPDGVISVRFSDKESATKCIELMNGRFFGGRQIEVGLHDGVTNYARESEQQQAERLEKFARDLEAAEGALE